MTTSTASGLQRIINSIIVSVVVLAGVLGVVVYSIMPRPVGVFLEMGALGENRDGARYYSAWCRDGRVWISLRSERPEATDRAFFDGFVPLEVNSVHLACTDFSGVPGSVEIIVGHP